MTNERTVPTPAPADLPTFTILSDGEEVSSALQVVSVAVMKAVNRIAFATLLIADGDSAQSDFPLSNSEAFIPGKEITIRAGYHSDETDIFRGVVIRHGIKVRHGKPGLLEVFCKDAAVKMTVTRHSAAFADMTDSDIISEIIGRYGLTAEVGTTSVEHKEMVQFYCSDWDFLVTRAEANGMLVLVDDGKISVKTPDVAQDPKLSLLYGATMLEFEAEMDARQQFSGVKSSAWDTANQEWVEQEAADPGVREAGNLDGATLAAVTGEMPLLRHSGRVASEELSAWANAALLRSRLGKIIGRVRCQGFADLKPGDVLELKGVGERFSGPVLVTAIRHAITAKNWESDIQFGLSPEWFSRQVDIIDRPAGGLLPAVNGLQIGVVTQLQDDPEGEHRVLVRLPVVDPQGDGLWARVATLDAGENRGTFFRPEIGDEVVLGFLNDDPRDPVVLGSLHSSAKPAPLDASDENPEKGVITRSGMKMIFNDEVVSLKIETPNGNVLTLSEENGGILLQDENGNKMELNASGITIESAADLTLKASGEVKMEGGANTSIKAGGQFKAEGSGGAEVSTGAVAVLKGSLVQIN